MSVSLKSEGFHLQDPDQRSPAAVLLSIHFMDREKHVYQSTAISI